MVSSSLLIVVAFGVFSGASAQTTDASCLPFYQWVSGPDRIRSCCSDFLDNQTSNSHKKSPCEVASTLLGVCTGCKHFSDGIVDCHSQWLGSIQCGRITPGYSLHWAHFGISQPMPVQHRGVLTYERMWFLPRSHL